VSVAGVDGRGCKRDEHAEHLYNVQRLSVICKALSTDRHAGGDSLTSGLPKKTTTAGSKEEPLRAGDAEPEGVDSGRGARRKAKSELL